MDLLHLATDWAKSEVFSTRFFILFAILFIVAGIGFWQIGKTDLAKAYFIPLLVAGVLLLIIGGGLNYTNIQRVKQFETDFKADSFAFYQSEMNRADSTLQEYRMVFKVIPILIIVACLLLLLLHSPVWRAISITTIAMLTIILIVDGTAYARMENYQKALHSIDHQAIE